MANSKANDLQRRKKVEDWVQSVLIDLRLDGKVNAEKPMKRAKVLKHIRAKAPALKVTDGDMRMAVAELAKAGIPVCSTTKGYFYALHPGEMEHPINFITSYARELEARARGLVKARKNMENRPQFKLFKEGK
jgi:hypothetical protein